MAQAVRISVRERFNNVLKDYEREMLSDHVEKDTFKERAEGVDFIASEIEQLKTIVRDWVKYDGLKQQRQQQAGT